MGAKRKTLSLATSIHNQQCHVNKVRIDSVVVLHLLSMNRFIEMRFVSLE